MDLLKKDRIYILKLKYKMYSGLSMAAIKNLDVEYTRMVRDIKLPEGEDGGLMAAAAAYGAARTAEQAQQVP